MRTTVVLAGRNEERRVEETMESLFAQTRLPDEIVVADGCSSDGTVRRVLRHAGRGVPLRVVRNDSIYAGGGRNAATRAAEHDVIVVMDFGNRAARDWLEAMVRPFEEDPALDLQGGLYYPIVDTPFQRVSAAVAYFEDCLLPTMDRDAIARLVPPNFVPGGMCMAYRRSAWARAGGFCEWARKGQDRLFGFRVRKIGGKVAYTLNAVVHHHMPDSFGELCDRRYHYALWAARTALPRRHSRKLLPTYAAGLALVVSAPMAPWLLGPLAGLAVAYGYVRAWKKLDAVAKATGRGFRARERLLVLGILVAHDAALLAGNLIGAADRLLRPRWRRRTRAYLERGE